MGLSSGSFRQVMSVVDRFMQYVMPEPNSGCWLWTGTCAKHPRTGLEYPMFRLGKNRRGNRVAYELFVGTLPQGAVVRHRCDVTTCVNPQHLCLGTQKDNVDDRDRRGRWGGQFGEGHRDAKLMQADVIEIRKRLASGEQQKVIAAAYGVSTYPIWAIKHGKNWNRT